MGIQENIMQLRKELSPGVTLIAVSKTRPDSEILAAYEAGQRVFGENKAQEVATKHHDLPKDIAWHFIGHLQTNKVKYIAPFISLIHSVDSLKLLIEINREASKNNRVIDCLLQFHIATEETKFGLDLPEARLILGSSRFPELKNICLKGVMGMASFSDDSKLVRAEFSALHNYYARL